MALADDPVRDEKKVFVETMAGGSKKEEKSRKNNEKDTLKRTMTSETTKGNGSGQRSLTSSGRIRRPMSRSRHTLSQFYNTKCFRIFPMDFDKLILVLKEIKE